MFMDFLKAVEEKFALKNEFSLVFQLPSSWRWLKHGVTKNFVNNTNNEKNIQ